MPAKKGHAAEFKEQSVHFVCEHIRPDESRSSACARLGPKLNGKVVMLCNWVKPASPKPLKPAAAGSVEELKAQSAEIRELTRANQILYDAAVFFGAALDRRQIAPSSVRSALTLPTCARRLEDEEQRVSIAEIFVDNYEIYGARKLTTALTIEHGLVIGLMLGSPNR
jgi:transposase-like protein